MSHLEMLKMLLKIPEWWRFYRRCILGQEFCVKYWKSPRSEVRIWTRFTVAEVCLVRAFCIVTWWMLWDLYS